MSRTAPDHDECTATDVEPYMRRAPSRSLQRVIAIHTAVELAVCGLALLALAAGMGVWAIRAIL